MLLRLSENARLYHADCRDAIRELPDNSIDSVVTDPPYALVSIVKRFGGANAAPAKGNDAYMRASAGFMNKTWDTGETAFSEEFWREVLRVLKPGGHVAAFGASRGYHRMACAIEDAGFEIRDSLMWVYGTGFPKSHDVSKGIDKAAPRAGMFEPFALHYSERRAASGLTHNAICEAGKFYAEHNHGGASTNWEKGHNVPTLAQWAVLQPLLSLSDEWLPLIERVEAEREVIGQHKQPAAASIWMENYGQGTANAAGQITISGTDVARQWEGWGTALKPAFEPIVLARKPLSEGTVAANVLRWGTGALNIGACRVACAEGDYASGGKNEGIGVRQTEGQKHERTEQHAAGRWPANICHDGSEEVVGAFPNTNKPNGRPNCAGKDYEIKNRQIYGKDSAQHYDGGYMDSGSAARFYYSAKASRADRAGSSHPTVKPIALMQWLARIITPPGGTVLDPFAGSGTTGAACEREGFSVVLCEREDEYVEDIQRRFDPNAAPVATQSGRRISRIFADEKGVKGGRLDKADPLARLLRWNAAVTAYRSRVAAHV